MVESGVPVRVPASLLSIGSGFDPRLTMWLGSGASSGSPHIVFDSPLSSAGFLLLRFPYLIARECRFTVYGLKSSDISDYYYWDSSSAGSASIADRLSSDKRWRYLLHLLYLVLLFVLLLVWFSPLYYLYWQLNCLY